MSELQAEAAQSPGDDVRVGSRAEGTADGGEGEGRAHRLGTITHLLRTHLEKDIRYNTDIYLTRIKNSDKCD